MTVRIYADSLDEASPLICQALKNHALLPTEIQVFIEPEFLGYWAELKTNQKPVDELSVSELKRAVRVIKNPQPYDVRMVAWPAWMYREISKGEKSSAF